MTDEKHSKRAKRAEDVSMTMTAVSAIVGTGAAIAAPTGLSAIGVAIGITSTPLIVTAAPIIATVATVTGVVSSGAYFYAKWKS